MDRQEIRESVSNFIIDKVLNDIDDEIFHGKENFDYDERKDIYIVGKTIKIGEKLEIIISALVEIDDIDNNHENEPEYFVQFLSGGKNV